MQDLLQYIDLDYYRSAQLVIVRAEIAQLRRQSSALTRTDQTAHAPPIVQSASPETKSLRQIDN
jgi:hypothetical protein